MDTETEAHNFCWTGRSPGHSSSHHNKRWHTAPRRPSYLSTPVDMHHPDPHIQLLSCTSSPVDMHLRVETHWWHSLAVVVLFVIISSSGCKNSSRVPEQGWELQSLVWMCGPWHFLPPCSAEGELQNRSRIWTPESHLDEQLDHWDQVDHPPFTESKRMISVFLPYYIALEEWRSIIVTWTLNSVARFLLLIVSKAWRVSIVKSCKCVIAASETSSESNVIYMVETCFTAFWPTGPFTPQPICQTFTKVRQNIE